MTLEKDIEKLYDDRKPSGIHLYLRPIVILLCCVAGFYAFRVIILDYITGENEIDVYAARKQMEKGDFKQAEVILKQVLEKQPNFSIANKRLGFLYLQQDQLEKALEFYNKALPYSPESDDIEDTIALITKRLESKD